MTRKYEEALGTFHVLFSSKNFIDDLNCSPDLKNEKSTNKQVQDNYCWTGNFHVSVKREFTQKRLSPLVYMIEQINLL